jgi:hypothetical protein
MPSPSPASPATRLCEAVGLGVGKDMIQPRFIPRAPPTLLCHPALRWSGGGGEDETRRVSQTMQHV